MNEKTRRNVLAGFGVGAVSSLAGCGGTSSGTEPTGDPSATETEARGPQQAKLTADDGDTYDNFGRPVAADGDTALIGAWSDEDPNGDTAGSAYVFTRSEETWSQQAKLTADDGNSEDQFGASVAIAGDTAIIGANGDEGEGGNALTDRYTGSAYVFTRSGGTWSQQAKLTAPEGNADDRFGSSVAVAGETVLIGALGEEAPNGEFAGAVYVFTRSGGTWSQQAKLSADDGNSYDYFGDSVVFEGDTALIGAPHEEDPNGDQSGAAYVFTRTSETWSQQAKLTPDDGDANDQFGDSVALAGDTALISAPYDSAPNRDSAGAAYIFTKTEGAWSQHTKLTADDGDAGDNFGTAVTLTGDTALIGAGGDENQNGDKAGASYVFTRTDRTWRQRKKFIAEDGDSKDNFGAASMLTGDTALIGAPGDEDPNDEGAGSAYVFELPS